MDFKNLGEALLKAGAPVLKGVVENAIGGIGGKLAGAAIDTLAANLGVPATPEAIVQKIERDPVGSTTIIQQVENEFKAAVDAGVGEQSRYIELQMLDAKSEGILSRLWRPLFALVFTVCYAVVIFSICYLMLNRELGTLNQLQEVMGFLTFAFIAGCAVLGIQVWKRTEEKKIGI